jgi:hypothetical protein
MKRTVPDLQDRIERYLDGALDEAETIGFEQELSSTEVADRFREALMLRKLLEALPPEHPPRGLVERIEAAMALDAEQGQMKRKAQAEARTGGIRELTKAGLRWPVWALAGLSGGAGALRISMTGMQSIGYSLGPLGRPARKGVEPIPRQRKPLWKMVLSRAWRRLAI